MGDILMNMQRLHFQFIADTVKDFGGRDDLPGSTAVFDRGRLGRHFASALSRTNCNFDRDRFLKACGVQT